MGGGSEEVKIDRIGVQRSAGVQPKENVQTLFIKEFLGIFQTSLQIFESTYIE